MTFKPRNRIPWTPALASALLAAGVLVQALLPWATELPPPPPPARGAVALAAPEVQPLAETIDITRRTMFAPNRTYFGDAAAGAAGAGGAGAAGSDPLSGLTLIGAARTRSAAYGVFREPGGRSRTLALGESYAGWRLVALDSERAVLARSGLRRTLRIGVPGAAGGTPPAPVPAAFDEEDEE